MRPVRLTLLALFALALVVLLTAAVVRTYLSSTHAAERAAAVLSRACRAPVRVGAADVNLDATRLRDVRIYEPDAGPDDEPFAVADDVRADVSLWDLLGGQALPDSVRLDRARVTLRFDETGHLLTRLQLRHGREHLPAIRIGDAQVTLKQAGRPDLVVTGVDATLAPDDGELRLVGQGRDPRWGLWDLDGGLDPVAGVCWLTIKSAGSVTLREQTLLDLPFVNPKVWQAIRAEGQSPVELTVRYDPAVGRVRYKLTLDPQDTDLHVIPIDLHATRASGQVTVENALVTLRNVSGRMADGDVQVKGDLDFRTPPTQMDFEVKVQRVDITQLPRKWSLPTNLVHGRLTGEAKLAVTVTQGKAKATGEGEGEVAEVPVGFGRKATFPVRLLADENGFHFRPGLPKTTGWGLATPAAVGSH